MSCGFLDSLEELEEEIDMRKVVAQLPEPLRTLTILRFGLEDGCPMTLEEVGMELEMRRGEVHYLAKKALAALRRMPTCREFWRSHEQRELWVCPRV